MQKMLISWVAVVRSCKRLAWNKLSVFSASRGPSSEPLLCTSHPCVCTPPTSSINTYLALTSYFQVRHLPKLAYPSPIGSNVGFATASTCLPTKVSAVTNPRPQQFTMQSAQLHHFLMANITMARAKALLDAHPSALEGPYIPTQFLSRLP